MTTQLLAVLLKQGIQEPLVGENKHYWSYVKVQKFV